MIYYCRGCSATLTTTFADLGRSPLSNEFKTAEELECAESTYPLHVFVCDVCKLVQLPHHVYPGKIFNENYAYFSSVVPSLVAHAKNYADQMMERFHLDENSFVVEAGGNDGYLLQHFKDKTQVLNVEPSASVAKISREKGIPTTEVFFGYKGALSVLETQPHADLIHGANVLAHTPVLRDFIAGLALLLKPEGTITLEFPSVQKLMKDTQLDMIYHEHYSYLSLLALEPIFKKHKLRMYDVEHLSTQGGSVRLYVCHDAAPFSATEALVVTMGEELMCGMGEIDVYTEFAAKCVQVKLSLLEFLIQAKRNGCRVAGYGAPAKATTLFNYCGVGPELLPYVVDETPAKIGKFIPGVQIPIYHPGIQPNHLEPTHYLILAWNLAKVIRAKIPRHITAVVPIPVVRTIDSDLNMWPVEQYLPGLSA